MALGLLALGLALGMYISGCLCQFHLRFVHFLKIDKVPLDFKKKTFIPNTVLLFIWNVITINKGLYVTRIY